MDIKRLNTLLDEPHSGTLFLLEKSELLMKKGLLLDRDKFYKRVNNKHGEESVSAMWKTFTGFMFHQHNVLRIEEYGPDSFDYLLKAVKEKVSGRIFHPLFHEDKVEIFTTNGIDSCSMSYSFMKGFVYKKDLKKFKSIWDSPGGEAYFRLKEEGPSRKQFKEDLDKLLKIKIEEAKQEMVIKFEDIINVSGTVSKTIQERLKVFYPKEDLSNINSDEAIALLRNAKINLIRFETLESLYFFFKHDFLNLKRRPPLIIKELTQFDKKILNISL